ncbi:MAG: hypothetical protein K9K65_16710 [Desulfarculaceae bacterium]|nr:hypothetical protein [Desulfarculaceae bacterium]MCF8049072.1 hypothetical protein [Desulfarculaceae bacterium]MCF8065227.1 hypothetical protein [Desulfarculaceae bacterium]MCF8099482.1 hypothetical protein [Desulfarculaceae bacterium]
MQELTVNNIAAIVLDAQAANHYYIVWTEGKPVVLGAASGEALQRFPKPSLSLSDKFYELLVEGGR